MKGNIMKLRTNVSSLNVLKKEQHIRKIWTINATSRDCHESPPQQIMTHHYHPNRNMKYPPMMMMYKNKLMNETKVNYPSLESRRYQSSLAEECHHSHEEEEEYDDYEVEDSSSPSDGSIVKRSHPSQPHCSTCTCENNNNNNSSSQESVKEDEEYNNDNKSSSDCGLKSLSEIDDDFLPEALPEPVYSFYKRVLPESLIALNSEEGRDMLLACNNLKVYFSLAEQFMNQSDPAYCGVTTLAMMLNVYKQDPSSLRWKGGWRFYADEQSVLSHCTCYLNHPQYIKRKGITMEEFQTLTQCHKIPVQSFYASHTSYPQFQSHIQQIFSNNNDSSSEEQYIIVSFARSKLKQTGDGHFSPLAAYHEPSNQVLLLDVARFKYTPYWIPLETLYNAMTEVDAVTQKSRGWFLFSTPPHQQEPEAQKQAHNIPLMKDVQKQNQQRLILTQQQTNSSSSERNLSIKTPSCPETMTTKN